MAASGQRQGVQAQIHGRDTCTFDLKNDLRTVTANIIPKYFCAVYDYAGKADLSKGYWNPKRKLGVTTHFQR